METLTVKTSRTGDDLKRFPINVKQAQSVPFIVHVEQCLRTRVSQSLFVSVLFKGSFVLLVSFFFASNRFFQEPVPEEDKNRNPQ